MTLQSDNFVPVTPTHKIKVPNEIIALIKKPRDHDFVIRTLATKIANGQPLIQGELVVAGHDSLRDYPLATQYPIHFKKTYYPTCFHQNPSKEFNYHTLASKHLAIAPPIGHTKTTFRSCFIPGTAYSRLSPFGVEPIQQNLTLGDSIPAPTLIGLWELLVRLHAQITELHKQGMVHGDMFLHNVVISTCPIRVNLIDFELAKTREEIKDDEKWNKLLRADCEEIWKHAIYLQCALGRQSGLLAEESLSKIGDFFPDTDQVLNRLDQAAPR